MRLASGGAEPSHEGSDGRGLKTMEVTMKVLTVIVRLRLFRREILRLCVLVSQHMPQNRTGRGLAPLAQRLLSWALTRGRAPPA